MPRKKVKVTLGVHPETLWRIWLAGEICSSTQVESTEVYKPKKWSAERVGGLKHVIVVPHLAIRHTTGTQSQRNVRKQPENQTSVPKVGVLKRQANVFVFQERNNLL